MLLRFDIKFRNSQKCIALFGKTNGLKRIRFYNNLIIMEIDSLQVSNLLFIKIEWLNFEF
jgi:hypothetical protein